MKCLALCFTYVGAQTFFAFTLSSSIHSFSRYLWNTYLSAEEETVTLASKILHYPDSLPASQMFKNPFLFPPGCGCNPGLLFFLFYSLCSLTLRNLALSLPPLQAIQVTQFYNPGFFTKQQTHISSWLLDMSFWSWE